MRKFYEVSYLQTDKSIDWNAIPKIQIDQFPWDLDLEKTPKTEVQLFYTDTYIRIFYKVFESNPKAIYTQPNDPVFKDSCVEFFVNPKPDEDDRYLNIEINALGTALIGIRNSRLNRRLVEDREGLKIHASIYPSYWTIDLGIDFRFFEHFYGTLPIQKGYKMKANFFKCGDETDRPHYGSWNPIKSERPDFHQPVFFGELIFK